MLIFISKMQYALQINYESRMSQDNYCRTQRTNKRERGRAREGIRDNKIQCMQKRKRERGEIEKKLYSLHRDSLECEGLACKTNTENDNAY